MEMFEPLKLAGTYAVHLKPHVDDRGYLVVTYEAEAFRRHGLVTEWVQDNQSVSTRRGIIRGLHFQHPPHTETKLVRVVAGAIWDVFVDLRKGSPTFGRWDGIELSDSSHVMAYIPKGFAHGFCTLTPSATVVYKVDAYFSAEGSGGLRWDDPDLAISWPTQEAFLSPRDRAQPFLKDAKLAF
jgi:dTDP-4-dehydrorhamnose 3,5-epimerase